MFKNLLREAKPTNGYHDNTDNQENRDSNYGAGSDADGDSFISDDKGFDPGTPYGANDSMMADPALGDDDVINTETFGELELDIEARRGAQDTWNEFCKSAGSNDAAGDAIYTALFEGAPSLQTLFVTPKAVQAIRFMNGLSSFVSTLDDPPQLKVLVETLGFGHLNLEVTEPRVIMFRDAILDLFEVELGSSFTDKARFGWKTLLNYIGGAIIFVRTNYTERLKILHESWKQANRQTDDLDVLGHEELSDEGKHEIEEGSTKKAGSIWKSLFFKKEDVVSGEKQMGLLKTDDKGNQQASIPKNYVDMFKFNAAVMGFSQHVWMNEVLVCFDTIVTNVSNSARLQEECDVLVLRITKIMGTAAYSVDLGMYKSCMMASLRSLLPKAWDSAHEVVWIWLWESVERLMRKTMSSIPQYEKKLKKLLDSFDEAQMFELRKEIYSRFFVMAPVGQDYFKQSNTYLHFIAERILMMTSEMFENPMKMVDDISALGLRHVGYGIPTDLFGPFVTSCIEVMADSADDAVAVDGFRWSLGLISKMLVRTIHEGSTIVIKAIEANTAAKLRKAVSCAPRGERASWLLIVQVGTQSISPLAWAIKSGCLEAAKAIIEDLLTIRADRERYYFGIDELFKHHPDIVKILIDDAPTLLPTLLDRMVWRCHRTEGQGDGNDKSRGKGLRRVNYYVKHLFLAQDGSPSHTLQWLTDYKDPATMEHPVIVMVSDTLWLNIVVHRFILRKAWFVCSLLIFMSTQSILPKVNYPDAPSKDVNWIILIGRSINYFCCLTRFVISHTRKIFNAYLTRELTFVFRCIPLPTYLGDTQSLASFVLMLLFIALLTCEPIILCATSEEEPKPEFPTEICERSEEAMLRYSVFGMFAMCIQWGQIVDMAIFSTQLSAFAMVVNHVLSEMSRFMVALVFLLLTFGSAISVLQHDAEDLQDIGQAAVALFAITVKLYQDDYRGIEDPALILGIFLYQTTTAIVLLNLLIAQLQSSYEIVYDDAIGYARLNRSTVIAESLHTVKREHWDKFILTLRFDEKLEFNEGDIGINGGLQDYESARLHPIVEDTIQRYGGSCEPTLQWPEDTAKVEEEDRLDRLEKLLQRTIKRMHVGSKEDRAKGYNAGGSSVSSGGTGSDVS